MPWTGHKIPAKILMPCLDGLNFVFGALQPIVARISQNEAAIHIDTKERSFRLPLKASLHMNTDRDIYR